ncbi:hypothetical protein N7456_000981 [Penicillium angulare]|uniref:Short-chain dehydrogenase/reductase SDR n=1 Tax=Penicillium angulare TaxID=116970 RepID=A0A9W9GEJ9_9EURO|nr:hypothetical protein N7456_000981 [Penicillium angulare]
MVMIRLAAEQYRKLPLLVDEETCIGKTYVITGGNSGLGLETARHLVAASAERVVLAVRNLKSGEAAKEDIEKTTARKGVIDLRHLDMSSYESVQSFVQDISESLDRIDGFICNAGVMLDAWSETENMETSMFVNVVSTLFLGILMIPKLKTVRKKTEHEAQPVSVLGYTANGEMDKSREAPIFEGLNEKKRANMNSRYALTKLVEEFAVRELASLCPVVKTGVIITMVAPGLCNTGLGRDAGTITKFMHEGIRAMMARTAEEGSRTYLHGLLVGHEGHGRLLCGCRVKEFWVPTWVTNQEGRTLQKGIWDELTTMLESVQPGCVSQLHVSG